MRTTNLVGVLCCFLSISNLWANEPDTLAALSPVVNYGHVVETAVFPGGHEALTAWVDSTIIITSFPEEGLPAGRLIVSFAVGSDGQVFDVSIDEGIGQTFDEEVAGVIKAMPKWRPARFGETPICMRMRLAIAFGVGERRRR